LLHQFLSPLANQHQDADGGSFENLLRFALEVFAAVRGEFDGVPGVRRSASDGVEGGWDLAQSQALCRLPGAVGSRLFVPATILALLTTSGANGVWQRHNRPAITRRPPNPCKACI